MPSDVDMKKLHLILILIVIILTNVSSAQTSRVGTNLSGLYYWMPQIMFKDAFKQCDNWLTRNSTSGGPWNTSAAIPMRADGYPLQVPFGTVPQYVHTVMFLGAGGTYPSGTYTILSDGSGTIQLEWDCGNLTYTSPCNNTFNVNSTNQGMHLTITSSDVKDPVHNIRIIMPGFINNYLSDPYYPKFLNFIDSADVFFGLRFMDLMKTNNSPVSTWSQRTTKEYFSQTTNNGIAYEYMIDLCNRLNKDLWVCIPHQADDNFIQNFATLLRDGVEPERKIYVEYTNEAWNSIFSQNQYCNIQGALLGFSGQAWEQGWKFYAKRTADCHRIFETVFGASNPRLVKVVATQASNSWLGNQIMTFYNSNTYNPTGVKANALAIAPYFGASIADSIGNAGSVSSITVDQIVKSMHAQVYSVTAKNVAEYITVAKKYGVDLIAYEGGQHLVANTYQNDTMLTNKLIAANRHPLMQTIYCDMFNVWFNNGGKEFFNFSSIYNPGKYGSWGVLEHSEQSLRSSYKWMGIYQCGSRVSTFAKEENTIPDEFVLDQNYPNPFNPETVISYKIPVSGHVSLKVVDVLGREVATLVDELKNPGTYNSHFSVLNSSLSTGIYFYKLTAGNYMAVRKMILLK